MSLQTRTFLGRVRHDAGCNCELATLAREFRHGNNQNVVLVGGLPLYKSILVEHLSNDTLI